MTEKDTRVVLFPEVDTPSLLLDAPALKANIQRMAAFFADRPCKLRPHFKSHKCTTIARLQMVAGAVGITCAKLGEAEVVADAGIRNILIANQIVGPIKIRRLIELCRRADPMVAVDSIDVGRKGFGAEWGAPRVKNLPGAQVVSFGSEEHMKIAVPQDSAVRIGDRIEIIPSHGCTTSNLYSEFVVHQDGAVIDSWPVEGRGKLT